MTDEPNDDRKITELLRMMEQDGSQTSRNREDIREQVLGHYDQLRDIDDHDSNPHETEIEVLVGFDDAAQAQSRWTAWVAAAVAIAIVSIGIFLLTNNNPDSLDTARREDIPTNCLLYTSDAADE